MVIIKIGADTNQERELEIVNEKGDWENGNYHLFAAAFIHKEDKIKPEPHDINSEAFLGEINIEKEKRTWNYTGNKLNKEEQKQVAEFIIDYSAPDGVY